MSTNLITPLIRYDNIFITNLIFLTWKQKRLHFFQ